ncbi:fibroblast growth factor binding protein 2a [Oreochromis niloticus]|uniref:Fibroblast growth factor binding protein 2a n=1 Tax=Oreochromis niloticus TaxID=8128 RepID=I3IYI5_ORENI|nr:fibroblast growth factor-binding protein 2-like [Oreochromis niloticus]CAI5653034.1 unnamed protein product [Mustela putorius furo]
MWAQTAALLLACCFWPAEAQTKRGQSIWDPPIKFNTKAKDSCTMIVTGQGEFTRLRLACQRNKRSYWCDYMGKPQTCTPYNKNPRHYFVQMMWNLRKLDNACQAPKQIKPHMCRKATDDSQMVFSSSPFSQSRAEASSRKVARPQRRPRPTRQADAKSIQEPQQEKTTQETSTQPPPTTTPVESNAKRMARQNCWRSLQGICSFFIGLFRN